MRDRFIKILENEASKNRNIILLTGDLGFTVFENFMTKFPHQFLNMGVAEANMMGVASGLALSGKLPIVYSIAPFVTLRPYEQIRNDICMHSANVKIIGVGGGLAYSHAGPTHHVNEDIAIMRTLPNMTVVCPADPIETELAVKAAMKYNGPVYIRLGKKGESNIYNKNPSFSLGKGIIVEKGHDIALICSGPIIYNVIRASNILKKKGYKTTIISMHTIAPLDYKLLSKIAKTHSAIFTIEEHSIIGGLGGSIAEFLSESNNKNYVFKRLGIPKEFCITIGDHNYLRDYYSLSPEKIAHTILKVILPLNEN